MKKVREPPKRKGVDGDAAVCAPKKQKRDPPGTSNEVLRNPDAASSPTIPAEDHTNAPEEETALTTDNDDESQITLGSSLDFRAVKCPDSWYLKQGDSGSFFLFEIRIVGDNPTPFKAMKVDPRTSEIFYRVCGRDLLFTPDHLYVSQHIFHQLPKSFSSADELNLAIQNLHDFNLCEGIPDDKYHLLQDLPIETGIFERNAWYSKRYGLIKAVLLKIKKIICLYLQLYDAMELGSRCRERPGSTPML